MEVTEQKGELRKLINSWSKQFPVDLKRKQEDAVFAILERLPQFVEAKNVGIYWSMPTEFFTHDFIAKWFDRKSFYLPKVIGEGLEFFKFEGVEKLSPSSIKNVLEPTGTQIAVDQLDLLIVPGVGFTVKGDRLGRGGGFYDRILTSSSVSSVALCYDFQVITELPLEVHDARVDLVLFYKGL